MRQDLHAAAALLLLASSCSLTNDPGELEPPPDTTAPAVPTGLTATPGNAAVTLQWNAVGDYYLDHYNVYARPDAEESFLLAGGTAGTALEVGSLTNETLHHFVVTAVDEAGNESDASDPVSATPDGTAPTVAFSPAGGATNEPVGVDLVLTFSEPMNRASVEGAVAVTSSVAVPACAWSWASGDAVAVCNFVSDLAFDKVYAVSVGTGARDLAGNALGAVANASFTTELTPDTTPPTVASSSPANGGTGAYPEGNIQVTFSEGMAQSATQGAFQIVSVSSGNVADYRNGLFSWSADGRTLGYDPPMSFNNGTLVTYSIGTGAQDVAGNPLAAVATRSYRVAYQGTVVIDSTPALDGYMRASSTTTTMYTTPTYIGMLVGDSAANEQYKSFVHFSHAAIPGTATRLLAATLSVYQYACTGAPYVNLDTLLFGKCIDSIFNDCDTDLKARHFNGGGSIDVGDFALAYLSAGPEVTESETVGTYGKSVLSYLTADRAAGRAYTWFRLELPLATNNDGIADTCLFYTGDYATDPTRRPRLTVTYEYP